MNQETWHRVDDCLADALDLPVSEREEYLAIRLGDDPKALAEALKLVGQAASAEQLFARGPLAGLGGLSAGARLGPWELVRPLGSGGMGVVWLARRADGQAAMMAAIKLLPPALSGPLRGDSDLLRGFLLEKQILARLHHPNIARLLDAGAGPGDTPNFVMEYVEGDPLMTFVRASTADRLRLFLKICDAVAYAHANLVIHRDLKPQNILVGMNGEPKLLDFGIAKILNDPAGDASITLRRAFSLDYASPEQIRGGPISTATDVYSLGLILYEMMTGDRARRWNDRALGEVLAESERFTLPARAGLNKDLRAVLGKATAVEVSRRYASVSDFAADVERLMEGRPVEARPVGTFYQLVCFARRNRWLVGAAAVALATIAGLGIWGMLSARTAQERAAQLQMALGAEQAATREAVAKGALARQMSELAQRREEQAEVGLRELLSVTDEVIVSAQRNVSKLPGGTKASIELMEMALARVEKMPVTAATRTNFLLLQAETHARLAELYGGGNSNLGNKASQRSHRERSVALWARLHALDGTRLEWERGWLESRFRLFLGTLRKEDGPRPAEWKQMEREFTALWRRARPDDRLTGRVLGSFYFFRAFWTPQESPRKRTDLEAALQYFSQRLKDPASEPATLRDLALAHKYLAGVSSLSGEERLRHSVEALRLDRIRSARDVDDASAKLDLGFSLVSVADAQWGIGNLLEAQRGYLEGYELRKRLAAMDAENVFAQRSLLYPMRNYGVLSVDLQDWAALRFAAKEFSWLGERQHSKLQGWDVATLAYWRGLTEEGSSAACGYFRQARRAVEDLKEGTSEPTRAELDKRVAGCVDSASPRP